MGRRVEGGGLRPPRDTCLRDEEQVGLSREGGDEAQTDVRLAACSNCGIGIHEPTSPAEPPDTSPEPSRPAQRLGSRR